MSLAKALLYRLMRDDVPAGAMEAHIIEAEKCAGKTCDYTNTHLAKYAEELAERLGAEVCLLSGPAR